jgi:hypothetical protein
MRYVKPTITVTKAVSTIHGAPKSDGVFDNQTMEIHTQTNAAYEADE